MALTIVEETELIRLMSKVQFPVSPDVFDVWCENFISNPVELAVVRNCGRTSQIFLIYRADKYYRGWHMPGSVLLPGRKVKQVLESLVKREVGLELAELKNPPVFLDYMEFAKGNGKGENPRGQKLSLLFVLKLESSEYVTADGGFFSLNELPEDLLTSHKVLVERVRRHLMT